MQNSQFLKLMYLCLLVITVTAACSTPVVVNDPQPVIEPPYASIYDLPLEMTWHLQYTGEMDYSQDVDMYNLDLFDTDTETIAELKAREIFVVCYFSAGTIEDWRADARDFPSPPWASPWTTGFLETWLDIRLLDQIAPVLEKRLDLAVAKGCDGVDPDNVNGFENFTFFPLTYEDQLAFNTFLANAAHKRGLAIGLKNDLEQINDLVPYYDWILNEQCFSHNECDKLMPFIEAGKPVFVIEYRLSTKKFCEEANQLNFNAARKKKKLDAYGEPCR